MTMCEGVVFPGHGEKVRCRRGYGCEACEPTISARSKGRYYCWHCRNPGTPSHGDIWGDCIVPPSRYAKLTFPGTPILPSLDPDAAHPYDAHVEAAHRREAEKRHHLQRIGQSCADACAALYGWCTRHNVSEEGQDDLLRVLRKLDNDGLVDLKRNLPATARTLKSNAEVILPSKDEVELTNIVFDTSWLMQTQMRAESAHLDIGAVIESILTNPVISSSPESFYSESGPLPKYQFEDGETAFGPEAWQTERAGELKKTAPWDAVVLYLIVWSDETDSASGTRHVMQLTLGNISVDLRFTDDAIRILAMLPQILIRKPRGERTERKTDSMRTIYNQIKLDAVAHALARAEGASRRGGVMHTIDGQRRLCVYKLLLYSADKKEDSMVTATTSGHDPRSYALTHARFHDKLRPYFCIHPAATPGTAPTRTPATELKNQWLTLNQRARRAKTAADKDAGAVGLKHMVKQQLHTFTSLIPPEAGGIYQATAMDFLHVVLTGLVPKFTKMLDGLFIRSFEKSPTMKSYEDVHQRLEERLQRIPSMFDGERRLTHFTFGWWAGRAGFETGGDWESLFQQLLFLYVGDGVLLPDADMRRRVVRTHLLFFSVYRYLKDRERWWSRATLEKLQTDITTLVGEFAWLQGMLEEPVPETHATSAAEKTDGNCPGDGLSIPKLLDFRYAPLQLRSMGCAEGASTSSFERKNKPIKTADAHSSRHFVENHGTNILLIAAVGEMRHNQQKIAGVAGSARGKRRWVEGGARRSFGARNSAPYDIAFAMEENIMGHLANARQGPIIDVKTLHHVPDAILGALASDNGVMFCDSIKVKYNGGPGTVWYAGNCVRLSDGSYAQILVPLVVAKTPANLPSDQIQFAVWPFENVKPSGDSLHPECDLPWLARSKLLVRVIDAVDVKDRVHIVPCEGDASRQHDDQRAHFLLDSGIWKMWAADSPPRPDVFRRCPNCGTPVKRPSEAAPSRPEVTCQNCQALFRF